MLDLVFSWQGWFFVGLLGPLLVLFVTCAYYFLDERKKYNSDPVNYQFVFSLNINLDKIDIQLLFWLFVLTFLSGPVGLWLIFGLTGSFFFDYKFAENRSSESRLDVTDHFGFACAGPLGLFVGIFTKFFDWFSLERKIYNFGEYLRKKRESST